MSHCGLGASSNVVTLAHPAYFLRSSRFDVELAQTLAESYYRVLQSSALFLFRISFFEFLFFRLISISHSCCSVPSTRAQLSPAVFAVPLLRDIALLLVHASPLLHREMPKVAFCLSLVFFNNNSQFISIADLINLAPPKHCRTRYLVYLIEKSIIWRLWMSIVDFRSTIGMLASLSLSRLIFDLIHLSFSL